MRGSEQPLHTATQRSTALQRPTEMPSTLADHIRQFQRSHTDNRRCCDCGDIGPTYICMDFGTFVCTTCAGLHREINHRVKGISISSWSEEEVEKILMLGNPNDKDMFLKFHRAQDFPPPQPGQIESLRQWIRAKYIEKRWTTEGYSSRLAGRNVAENLSKPSGETQMKRSTRARTSNPNSPTRSIPSPIASVSPVQASARKTVDDLLDGFSFDQPRSIQPKSDKSPAMCTNISPFGEPLIDPFIAWTNPHTTTSSSVKVGPERTLNPVVPQFVESPWNPNSLPDSCSPSWPNFNGSGGVTTVSTWSQHPSSKGTAQILSSTRSNRGNLLEPVGDTADPWKLSVQYESGTTPSKLPTESIDLFGLAEADITRVDSCSERVPSLEKGTAKTAATAHGGSSELKGDPIVAVAPTNLPPLVDTSPYNFTNLPSCSSLLSANPPLRSRDPFAELCDDANASQAAARNLSGQSTNNCLVDESDEVSNAVWLHTAKESSLCQPEPAVTQPTAISQQKSSLSSSSIDFAFELPGSFPLMSPASGCVVPVATTSKKGPQASEILSEGDPMDSNLFAPLSANSGDLNLEFASDTFIRGPGESTFQENRRSQNKDNQNLKQHGSTSGPIGGGNDKPHNEAPWSLKAPDDEFSWADFNTVPPFAEVGLTPDQMNNNPFCIN